jgi:hypothetical protein
VIDEISMVRCGYGSNIELFQYQSPDQAKTLPMTVVGARRGHPYFLELNDQRVTN